MFLCPARLDQALRTLLDRMVRDGLEPDDSLERAVGRIEHIYVTISDQIRST